MQAQLADNKCIVIFSRFQQNVVTISLEKSSKQDYFNEMTEPLSRESVKKKDVTIFWKKRLLQENNNLTLNRSSADEQIQNAKG